MHSKVLIIGSGPAGYTAAIYAARANLSPVMIMGDLVGGQLLYTHHIENFPAIETTSGISLIEAFQKQATDLGIKMIYEKVEQVDFQKKPFLLKLSNLENITADSVIIACGASPKWLEVNGEDKFKGKGISVCATCDGFFYRGKDVLVVGGGNTALYESLFLASLTNHIFLVNKDVDLNGEYNLIQQVKKNPKIQIINETTVTLFDGDNKLRSVWIKNIRTLEVQKIDIDGAFIAIGQQPNTDLFAGQLAIDEKGYLITDCQTRKTSVDGIFAAGDVQEKLFRQAIIACGAGAVAALSAEKYLIRKKS